MQKRWNYQKRLLEAVEAFLDETPEVQTQAHADIQHWVAEARNSAESMTLDDIIWGSFVIELTDSVFYENKTYLRDTRELLLGRDRRNRFTALFMGDCRSYFTVDEVAWYDHLLGMVDFLVAIPFVRFHEVIYPEFQNKERWETIRERVPEAAQVEKLEQDYEQRKVRLEEIAAKSPVPEDAGAESIYHLVLREVTSILAEIWVVPVAAYVGYPILGGPHSNFRGAGENQYPNMTEQIVWAKRVLEALSNEEGELLFSWRLHNVSSTDLTMLFVSLR
jgi:hypothetical protein